MAALTEHTILPLPAFDAPVRLLIVVAPYYRAIADGLIAGARATAEAAGAAVDLVEVPGALEIPTAVGMAGRLANYDAYVALGCVIRGETIHFEIVSMESSRALMDLAVARRLPLGNGIITVNTDEQAWERARKGELNKGGDAARAALAVLRIRRRLAKA